MLLLTKLFLFYSRIDTDSIIMSTTFRSIRNCFLKNMSEEQKDSLMQALFEDKGSERHSAGKLVIEGLHTAAYFRNPKAYILLKSSNDETDCRESGESGGSGGNETALGESLDESFDDESLDDALGRANVESETERLSELKKGVQRYVRMKGVPRSIREALHSQFFSQDVSKNSCNIRTVSLRGTLGHEMILLKESKNLSHCLNFKRQMNVS
jgi:hypothetical protein